MKREDMARFAEAMLRSATLVTGAQLGTDRMVLSWQSGGRSCELKVEPGLDGMLSYQFTMDPPKGTGGEG